MPPLFGIPSAEWMKIAVYVLVLGAIWIVMRFMMRLATRLFLFGCGAIVALGLVLLALRVIRGY